MAILLLWCFGCLFLCIFYNERSVVCCCCVVWVIAYCGDVGKVVFYENSSGYQKRTPQSALFLFVVWLHTTSPLRGGFISATSLLCLGLLSLFEFNWLLFGIYSTTPTTPHHHTNYRCANFIFLFISISYC